VAGAGPLILTGWPAMAECPAIFMKPQVQAQARPGYARAPPSSTARPCAVVEAEGLDLSFRPLARLALKMKNLALGLSTSCKSHRLARLRYRAGPKDLTRGRRCEGSASIVKQGSLPNVEDSRAHETRARNRLIWEELLYLLQMTLMGNTGRFDFEGSDHGNAHFKICRSGSAH
jgi:hypothetical protein